MSRSVTIPASFFPFSRTTTDQDPVRAHHLGDVGEGVLSVGRPDLRVHDVADQHRWASSGVGRASEAYPNHCATVHLPDLAAAPAAPLKGVLHDDARPRHRCRRFHRIHLCRRLVADGNEVVALDDLSEGSLDALRDVPEARFEKADICDAEAVASAARGCEVIYHQAAKRSVLRSMEQPVLTTRVNVDGTLNVLLAARDAGAVVVAASSSSVYGDQDVFPLDETMEPKPRSPYAVSKLAGETYGAALYRAYGVPSMWLRYFNVYGPGQDPESDYAAVVPVVHHGVLGRGASRDRRRRRAVEGFHVHRRRGRREPAVGGGARRGVRPGAEHRRGGRRPRR